MNSIHPAIRHQRLALLTLCLPMVMASLDTSIAHAAMPALAQAFDTTFRHAQAIILVYLLALTLLSVGAGRVGDAWGRRRVLLGGLTLFTCASLACALAVTMPVLLAARALQGAGAAVMVSLTFTFIADVVPGTGRGRAMGLLGTMSAAGTTLGPVVAGLLLTAGGWRAIFMVNLPLGLVALALAYRYLPHDAPRMAVARHSLITLVRERAVGASLAGTLLVSAVLMSTLVVGPFFLARALGLEPAIAGLVLAAGPLVAAVAGVPAGALVDRFGAARPARWGLGGIATGCAALALLPAVLAAYIGSLALITASYALFQAANSTLLLAAVPAARRGAASGLMGLARNAGLMAGTAGMGAVFAAGWGSVGTAQASAAAVVHGMRTTFGVCIALMLLALLITRIKPDAHP